MVLLSPRTSASVQAFDCVRLSEGLDAGEHRPELKACFCIRICCDKLCHTVKNSAESCTPPAQDSRAKSGTRLQASIYTSIAAIVANAVWLVAKQVCDSVETALAKRAF